MPAALAASCRAASSMTTGSELTSMPAHQAFALFAARGENDLQSAALALHRRAIFELHIHRLDVGVDVVNADAGLVVGVLREVCSRQPDSHHKV